MTSRCTWILGIGLSISACGGSPNAPSTVAPGDGITIYEHPKFRGNSMVLTADVEDLDDLHDGCYKENGLGSHVNFDDCISSIRIPQGFSVTVYEDPRYRGKSVTFTADVADLDDVQGPCGDDFDDCISSIRIRRR